MFRVRERIAVISLSSTVALTFWAYGIAGGVYDSPAAQAANTTVDVKKDALLGKDVPCEVWLNPKKGTKAILLAIHGLSLHAQSYAAFGKAMADLGYPTYAIDVRGFGAWQNNAQTERVDFKRAFSDIKLTLEALRKAHPGVPIVLLGESMGGALALQSAAQNQGLVDGLVCSVPAATRAGQKLTEAKVAIGMLTRPNHQMNAGVDVVKRATSDPELANVWSEDPLARMKLSAKELLAFAIMTSHNTTSAQELADMPVLFVQGGGDKLIKPIGTYDLFNKIKSPKKQLVMLGEWEHLIFEEEQFDDNVVNTLTSWIDNVVVPQLASKTADSGPKLPPEQRQEAEGHLKMAQGLILLKQPEPAEDHLKKVVAMARGTDLAIEAEALLCSLPHAVVAPVTGETSKLSDEEFRYVTKQQALGNDKPTVLMFYAPWIKSCDKVKTVTDTVLAKHGDKINFVMIDADAAQNQDLIRRYDIGPLPSVLFLDHDNEVVGYTIGFPGEETIEIKVRELVSRATTKSRGKAAS